MLFRQIFDPRLAQYAYLIGCQRTREAIVVDPERDVERYLELAERENLRLVAATETHIHADYLSGVRELAARLPGLAVYLSDEGDADWKYLWPARDGRAWTPLRHGAVIRVGGVELRVMASPGHTPEHLAFEVVDRGAGAREPLALLSGDFVFVGDLGRPDLLETAAGVVGAMEPSARRLFASAQRFLELPEYLQVWPGHGAGSACGKALGALPATTVGYERRTSPALARVMAGERPFVDYILDGQPEPPLYFARMKSLNRLGPPLLGGLPRPTRLSAVELARRVDDTATTIVDARHERAAFARRHARGSLCAPFNRAFPSVVGSFVDPESTVLLVIAESDLDEAVACCVRVGVDRVSGWAPPETLDELPDAAAAGLECVDFRAALDILGAQPGAASLDVRERAEFERGHLAGARRIAHTRLAAATAEVPAGQPLLVYCQTGSRAAPAASFLARRGRAVRLVDDDLSRLPEALLAR